RLGARTRLVRVAREAAAAYPTGCRHRRAPASSRLDSRRRGASLLRQPPAAHADRAVQSISMRRDLSRSRGVPRFLRVWAGLAGAGPRTNSIVVASAAFSRSTARRLAPSGIASRWLVPLMKQH